MRETFDPEIRKPWSEDISHIGKNFPGRFGNIGKFDKHSKQYRRIRSKSEESPGLIASYVASCRISFATPFGPQPARPHPNVPE